MALVDPVTSSTINSGCAVAVANILGCIESKKNDYKEGIKSNHTLCKIVADRLAIDGNLEQTLRLFTTGSNDDGSGAIFSEEEISNFLNEQRNRLKKLAEKNVDNERNITIFVKSLSTLKSKVLESVNSNTEDANVEGEEQKYDENTDYEILIKKMMDEERVNSEAMNLDYDDEGYCREIRKTLGEKEVSKKKKKRKRRNTQGVIVEEEEEVEEEIEVVRGVAQGGTGGDSSAMIASNNNSSSLKCPITNMYMRDAVRNKLCGHVYSREGIENHIRISTKGKPRWKVNVRCPVPGCNNDKLTMDQLEDDTETSMLVRRQLRRENTETQHRMERQSQNDESFDMSEYAEQVDGNGGNELDVVEQYS